MEKITTAAQRHKGHGERDQVVSDGKEAWSDKNNCHSPHETHRRKKGKRNGEKAGVRLKKYQNSSDTDQLVSSDIG